MRFSRPTEVGLTIIVRVCTYHLLLYDLLTRDLVPIYDLRAAVNSTLDKSLNQCTLREAIDWTDGEIPVDSFVCVHFVPHPYEHKQVVSKHDEIEWTMLRIVVLATPPNADL